MPGRSRSSLLLLISCSIALIGAAQPAPSPNTAPRQQPAPETSDADALFAQGQFAEAVPAYESALASHPDSAAALAGVARMRLYQGREAEAMELARKALALAPGNPVATATLTMAELRQKAFGPDLYQMEPQAAATSIDFVITDPLPVVRVTIGGRQANLLIDTGGPDIMIKPALAEALGLSLTGAGMGTFAGGRQAPVQRTVVPELEIGGIRIRNVPAAVNPAGLQLPGVQTDGIIGTGLLMHFLSTLDYCRGKLVLAPRGDSGKFEAQAAAAKANVVPMWLVGDHFIFARGRLNQAPEALFHIDTGLAGGGITANRASLDAAGVTIDESKALTGMGGGGPVRIVPFTADATLGSLIRHGVRGIHSIDGDPSTVFPFRTGGLLSHGFFRQSALTLDFEAMKLVTQECERGG